MNEFVLIRHFSLNFTNLINFLKDELTIFMMNSDTITALKSRAAFMPGGRDLSGHLLVIVTVPPELVPKSKEYLDLCLNFIIDTLNPETLNAGLCVVIDAQKSSHRLTNIWIEHVQSIVDPDYLKILLVIRSDVFWDKQRMDNCTKPQKKGEVSIFIDKCHLNMYEKCFIRFLFYLLRTIECLA